MSFNWYVNGDNVSTTSSLTYDFEASIGSDIVYEVILDGSSTHSCSSSDTLSITVHPDPIAAIDTLGLLLDCDNLLIDSNLIVAQNLNIVNDNYQWIFTNSSEDIIINSLLQRQSYWLIPVVM